MAKKLAPKNKKQSNTGLKAALKSVFNLNSSSGKLALFLLTFAVIGGGWMAYKSFAATGPMVFGHDRITFPPAGGRNGGTLRENQGNKRNMIVWRLTSLDGEPASSLRAKGYDGTTLSPQVVNRVNGNNIRACANVRIVQAPARFRVDYDHTRSGATDFQDYARSGTTLDYQKYCTPWAAIPAEGSTRVYGPGISISQGSIRISTLMFEFR